MPGHYRADDESFLLFRRPGAPRWRQPQIGALGALAARWSQPRSEPALVSLPTGSGKTAVALAAPYLVGARRVLVVVPSAALREQTASRFADQRQLVAIGAHDGSRLPSVHERIGLVKDWGTLAEYDVVVGLPDSLSPAHYPDNLPPRDLFDLVIVDEAHHAPAATWRAILDHFSDARALLLTATPYRRDGRHLPGTSAYHYPVRQALDDGVFKPVRAQILPPSSTTDRRSLDLQIASEVARLLGEPEHATSAALIRASSVERAKELATVYSDVGLDPVLLHSRLARATQESIVTGLRDGTHRAVAVVGMLGEGFDLPRLRIVGYHDKHRSLPATAQLIGRLARVDEGFPQESVLVAVRDVDVYPELEGVIRGLYEEDADWAAALPGILDKRIATEAADREYAASFTPPPPALAVGAIHPIRRSVVYELPSDTKALADLLSGAVPDELVPGRSVAGSTVFYSHLDAASDTLLLVTSTVTTPRWLHDSGLDTPEYQLVLVSLRQAPRTDLPALLFVNADDDRIAREVRKLVGVLDDARRADPSRLNQAFEGLARVSVSSVGVRTTLTGRGTPSYRMFAGSSVDRGMRDGDTAFGALGHAIIQATDAAGTFSAGVATGKGKYWEMRYAALREYAGFISWLADEYWFPKDSAAGQLLPQVSRGRRLDAWPVSDPIAAEFDHALLGQGWHTEDGAYLEALELGVSPASGPYLPFGLAWTDRSGVAHSWNGHLTLHGEVEPVGPDIRVGQGFAATRPLSDVLSSRPLTVFFVNGLVVRGAVAYDSRSRSLALPEGLIEALDWTGVDLTAETKATAAKHNTKGAKKVPPAPALRSVDEALEDYLRKRPRRLRHRWILGNDGPGEFADYIVVEQGGSQWEVWLWHAKAAGEAFASVRVPDLEKVVPQAIKSRRWITDAGFWSELGDRLEGRSRSGRRAAVLDGSERLLKAACGLDPRRQRTVWTRSKPHVAGHIRVVQPGLSESELSRKLAAGDLQAAQCHEILLTLHDAVAQHASVVVLGSP